MIDAAAVAPTVAESWTPRDKWDEVFATALSSSGRAARPTRAMACGASEIGRFVLLHRKLPPEVLRTFINGACGVVAPNVMVHWLTADIAADSSPQDLLARFRQQVASGVYKDLPAKATEVGFWAGQRDGRWTAVMQYAAAVADLKPFSLVADASGVITIEGRLLRDVAHISASVNQGPFGVASCLNDQTVALPQFRVSCRLAPEDQTAWLTIMFVAPQTVLGLPVAEVLARRDGAVALSMKEPAYPSHPPVTDVQAFRVAVVARLNLVRAQAGLGPVQLAQAQSDAATRVARPYFAAALGDASAAVEDMNTIALGLLAGWQVVGTIRNGTFMSGITSGIDPARWLDSALAHPIGRQAMLVRDIEEVALGPSFLNSTEGVGVLVTGYRLQHGTDHQADVDQLMSRIAQARQQHDLPPPVLLSGLTEYIARQLAEVQRGELVPKQAMRASMEGAARKFRVRVRGLAYETLFIEKLPISSELLRQTNLRMALGVTHHKPPGAAWAQLVIVIVFAENSGLSI
ncbi:MAG TPA: hypothetical protein VNO55_17885 [Polyangia bacterium]|nr:hypothetical protein [Polyangia bacterium]